jgi:hypothetical protein
VALALKEWLPDVLQNVSVWISEHDIDAGSRWSHKLAQALEESRIGIICLTPENQGSRWLQFEAGALSKSLEGESRLIPYLIDMSVSDVEPPLAQFKPLCQMKQVHWHCCTRLTLSVTTPFP